MSPSSPAPGWYPDPAGVGTRWWDGRSWTDFRQAATVTIVSQPPLPEGVSTGTLWILLQALIPLAQLAAQVPYLLSFRTLFGTQLAIMSRSRGSAISSADAHALLAQYAGAFGTFGVTSVLALVLSAAWVVLAVLDARALQRVGIVQPFHWAWSFLGPVYPIGRAVVLRRRIGRGIAPLWVLVAAFVATMLLGIGLEAAIFLPMFTGLASSPGFASS